MNHQQHFHLRSYSESTNLPPICHHHHQQQTNGINNNDSINSVQISESSANYVILTHSDSQKSLDRLFNPPPTSEASKPLRQRNLPLSFFNPTAQKKLPTNGGPDQLPHQQLRQNLHARSTSFDPRPLQQQQQLQRPMANAFHTRTHSVLAPMTGGLTSISSVSSNSSLQTTSLTSPDNCSNLSLHNQGASTPLYSSNGNLNTTTNQPVIQHHQHQQHHPQQQQHQFDHQQAPIIIHNQQQHSLNPGCGSHHYRNYSSPAYMQAPNNNNNNGAQQPSHLQHPHLQQQPPANHNHHQPAPYAQHHHHHHHVVSPDHIMDTDEAATYVAGYEEPIQHQYSNGNSQAVQSVNQPCYQQQPTLIRPTSYEIHQNHHSHKPQQLHHEHSPPNHDNQQQSSNCLLHQHQFQPPQVAPIQQQKFHITHSLPYATYEHQQRASNQSLASNNSVANCHMSVSQHQLAGSNPGEQQQNGAGLCLPITHSRSSSFDGRQARVAGSSHSRSQSTLLASGMSNLGINGDGGGSSGNVAPVGGNSFNDNNNNNNNNNSTTTQLQVEYTQQHQVVASQQQQHRVVAIGADPVGLVAASQCSSAASSTSNIITNGSSYNQIAPAPFLAGNIMDQAANRIDDWPNSYVKVQKANM